MDEMLDALIDLIKVKNERDDAFAKCDVSWGYHGYYLEEELKKAKERYASALSEYIQTELTGERGEQNESNK